MIISIELKPELQNRLRELASALREFYQEQLDEEGADFEIEQGISKWIENKDTTLKVLKENIEIWQQVLDNPNSISELEEEDLDALCTILSESKDSIGNDENRIFNIVHILRKYEKPDYYFEKN